MASIFTRTDDVTQKPPRNTFPMSYANNLSLKAGQIVPCYLQDVMPGDSIKIDTRFGFQFMPMIFPVQTDMQCNVHFFYVRNRALWKGWENFITKTENLDGDTVPPFIELTENNRDMFNTGDIGDYIGVPTVYYGSKNEMTNIYTKNFFRSSNLGYVMKFPLNPTATDDVVVLANAISAGASFSDGVAHTILAVLTTGYNSITGVDKFDFSKVSKQIKINSSNNDTGCLLVRVGMADIPPKTTSFTSFSLPTFYSSFGGESTTTFVTNGTRTRAVCSVVVDTTLYKRYIAGDKEVLAKDVVVACRCAAATPQGEFSSTLVKNTESSPTGVVYTLPDTGVEVHNYSLFSFNLSYIDEGELFTTATAVNQGTATFDASVGIPNENRTLDSLPFYTQEISDNPVYNQNNDARIRVTAMPFRAVEACYNAFYRDDRNNPLMIDGKPYYNVWVQNRDGGADTTRYTLYNKNWEQDVFTTAVQSPQQGIMPLVGVTASGNMTFADEDGNTYYMQAEFADDGKTITGISSYSSDMPAGTLRAMVDTISTGISINDFRNVNALQRWLETNMRKGLRYKDQIEAHFGTSPTYSELQMPEFIGGLSRSVHMSAVEQTVDTVGQIDGSPLGTLAGRASAVGSDGRPITHYCDEHGWIIGFVSITPRPVYSQTLNKMLTRTELLDYYFPEFGHIGFQPILNKELSPLQCKLGQTEDGTGTDDVFGYQRAWYEYLERYDEVHGDFRSTLRDFLIQRVFDGVPKLGKEFLLVGDKEVNEVFAVQDNSDKIFGQMVFDVVMKRPIPKFGIPKLEVG